jgi:hypothetical protein
MEIGIYTFADVATHPITRKTITLHRRMLNLMEEIELADQPDQKIYSAENN